jgi:hypothetical protein
MAYEQRPGDISIFAETDKKNEKAPDWKGTMIVPEGVQPGDKLEVAVWAKGDRGTMLAGSVKPPRQREEGFSGRRDEAVAGNGGGGGHTRSVGSDRGAAGSYDLSDDIPFIRTACDAEA